MTWCKIIEKCGTKCIFMLLHMTHILALFLTCFKGVSKMVMENHYINICETSLKTKNDLSSTSDRPRTLLRSFYCTKNHTSTTLSYFREFLKNKNSLESLKVILQFRSPGGIFGQNRSDLLKG